MKKVLTVFCLSFLVFTTSSFGVAENNKYVRAKTEKLSQKGNLLGLTPTIQKEMLDMKISTFENTDEKESVSIASSIGTFLLNTLKTMVQNLFSMLKN